MNPILRSLGFLLLGILLGGGIMFGVLGRYQIQLTGQGQGIGYLSRTDRWTGQTEVRLLMPRVSDYPQHLP